MKENTKQSIRNNFLSKIVIIVIAVLFVMHFDSILIAIRQFLTIIAPFVFGLGFAFIWNMLLKKVENLLFKNPKSTAAKKAKRPVSLFLSLLLIVAILGVLMYLVIPEIYNSILLLAQGLPTLAEDLQKWVLEKTAGLDWTKDFRQQIQNIELDWQSIATKASTFLRDGVGGILGTTFVFFGNLLGFFVSAFTAFVFMVYFLISKERIGWQMHKLTKAYLTEKSRNRILYVATVFKETFENFFKSQVLDAIIIGILVFIMMMIFRFEYALTISVIIMVTALIPMLGAFIGGAIGFLLIAIVDPKQAVFFLLALTVLQQIDGNVIYPRIVGDSLGLPGMWVFATVIVGGAIAGPLGMILGVPLIASIYKILARDTNDRIAEKREIENNQLNIEQVKGKERGDNDLI